MPVASLCFHVQTGDCVVEEKKKWRLCDLIFLYLVNVINVLFVKRNNCFCPHFPHLKQFEMKATLIHRLTNMIFSLTKQYPGT